MWTYCIGAIATTILATVIISRKAEKPPIPQPSFAIHAAMLNIIKSNPSCFALAGCNCSHFSILPEPDSLAFFEVLYNAKKPAKQEAIIKVYMLIVKEAKLYYPA